MQILVPVRVSPNDMSSPNLLRSSAACWELLQAYFWLCVVAAARLMSLCRLGPFMQYALAAANA